MAKRDSKKKTSKQEIDGAAEMLSGKSDEKTTGTGMKNTQSSNRDVPIRKPVAAPAQANTDSPAQIDVSVLEQRYQKSRG